VQCEFIFSVVYLSHLAYPIDHHSFNSALQIGTAIVISIITALHSTIAEHSPPGSYAPYRAEFYFMIALMTAEGLAVFLFYKTPQENGEPSEIEMGH
jgi:hypothetical protein